MDDGRNDDRVDFDLFHVQKFIPHIFTNTCNGCGANALALLTGELPESFPNKASWSTRFMLSFLRDRGFATQKITKNAVSQRFNPIANRHVLLILMRFISNEASWIVLNQDIVFHNFEITKLKTYEFLNHPIMDAYLLMHPSWNSPDFRMRKLGDRGEVVSCYYAADAIKRLPKRT